VTAAFVTMMLVLAVLDELKGRRRWFADVPAPLALVTIAVVAGLLALPRVDNADTGSGDFGEGTRDLADDVVPAVRGHGTVLIELERPFSRVNWYGPGLLLELVRAGVPIVTRDPVLMAQLGDDREYRGSADLTLYIVPGEGPPLFSPRAQLVGSTGRPTRAEDEERRHLRRSLRAALARAGGLPIEDPEAAAETVGQEQDVPDQFDLSGLMEQVDDLGPDPDAILDATTTWDLVALLDMLGVAHDTIDDEFPVDDLVRYGELRARSQGADVTVWLDELD
jgi:hypothetical protein